VKKIKVGARPTTAMAQIATVEVFDGKSDRLHGEAGDEQYEA
jgi:hypothetical protein